MDDKRAFQRHNLWFPVTIDTESGAVWAVCQDASAGGILVSGTDQLVVGQSVTLTFRTSLRAPERRVAGRVVRVDTTEDDPRSVWHHQIAIEFLEQIAELDARYEPPSSVRSRPDDRGSE